LSDPEIILLDEPFTGIDPVTIEDIQKIIKKLKARGISILITDHQVRETLDIVDRSYVIFKGAVLTQGTKSEVLAHPLARERYFGSNIDAGTSGPPAPHIAREAPAKRSTRGNVHEEETLREE
jgi:lipopolysaccharide export system ATP-binding protein